jgi:hypothetical protein
MFTVFRDFKQQEERGSEDGKAKSRAITGMAFTGYGIFLTKGQIG